MEKQIWYKIVEQKNNNIKTLFHGINRSRVLSIGEWIIAEKKIVSDGPRSTKYLSGLHILPSLEKTKKYLDRFKDKDTKKIVMCHAKGLRKKEHSKDDVYLADTIKIINHEI